MRLSHALVASMALIYPLVLAQGGTAGINDPCLTDQECSEGFCDFAPGATTPSCQPRPSGVGTRCTFNTDCQTGYCDGITLQCSAIPENMPCSDRAYCANNAVCEVMPGGSGTYCLAVGKNVGETCVVQEQCNSGLVCKEDNTCQPGQLELKGPDEQCGGASECDSGICEDKIADDGFERVCLAGNLENNEGCSHRYQCISGNCAAGSDGALICQDAATDPGTTDPGTTDPGTTDPGTTNPGNTDTGNNNNNNDNGNNNQQPEVVVITTVQNGQTLTLTQTRTVTVRGSNTAAASQRAASTSARPSSAAAVGSSAGGAIGWIIAGAAALLGGAAL